MNRSRAFLGPVVSICACLILLAAPAAAQQSSHAHSGARHHLPRRGVPTLNTGIADSLVRTISWLRPGQVGPTGMMAHHSNVQHAHVRNARRTTRSHFSPHSPQHHAHTAQAEVAPTPRQALQVQMDVVEPDSMQAAPMHEHELILDHGDGCGGCHPGGACDTCCLIPFPVFCWDNFEAGFGVQGFTGPTNRGETASFGINEYFNWGAAFPLLTMEELGGQFGMRLTQSNFSGAEFTRDERSQMFITTGFFHRVDWGFQGGLVLDYLRDDWYMEADLTQLRGELSWVFPCSHEWGFWFAADVGGDDVSSRVGQPGMVVVQQETFEPTDVYAFFYRYRAEEIGGEARGYAGFTGGSDGLIGADFRIPIAARWDIDCNFAYLIPEESSNNNGHVEEAWNLSANLVWYPGCRTTCDAAYYRPLFDVADNGTFFVDRR